MGHYFLLRVELWALIGPPSSCVSGPHWSYELSVSRCSAGKDGCFGGSGGFFPRFEPKLRRYLLFSGAIWSLVGFTGAHVSPVGEISPGHLLR